MNNAEMKKNIYESPRIDKIELDYEISLVLESLVDPGEPGISLMRTPEYFNNNPYQKV